MTATDAPVALLGAGDDPSATALCADLGALGWQVVAFELDRPRERPNADVAVLATAGAFGSCVRVSEALRHAPDDGPPILWVVDQPDLGTLELHTALFDDFLRAPYSAAELDARLRRLRRGSGEGIATIRIGRLEMEPASYRASVDGRALRLTYMEYELLRYLAARPGRIHTREAILRGVWGYDYYGGVRTVDVHIRRLRAKLGQEHGRMVETVRGVGYGVIER